MHYYIGFAYKILRMPLKTYECWNKAQKLNKGDRTLSRYQQKQVDLFQNEYLLF